MRFTIFLCGSVFASVTAASSPQVIDVITVEYPPYTTPVRADDGLMFRELRAWVSARNVPVVLRPNFLPPARAQLVLNTTDWCLSLYPPSHKTPLYFQRISDSSIKIGLVRKKVEGEFDWQDTDYFKGATIAILRSIELSEMWRSFKEAGAIFVYVETVEQGMTMVLKDRVDYAFADRKGVDAFRQRDPRGVELQYSKKDLEEFPIGVFLSALCKGIFGEETEDRKRPEH